VHRALQGASADAMSCVTSPISLRKALCLLAFGICLLGGSIAAHAEDASDRLRVFPEDVTLGWSHELPGPIDDAPQTLAGRQAQHHAESQVIVAPMPPAVLTGLPLLAGLWVVRHYRMWLRSV
jgi:hypothetical protein